MHDYKASLASCRNAKSVVPSDQSTCSAAARATEAKLKSQGLTLDADPGIEPMSLLL